MRLLIIIISLLFTLINCAVESHDNSETENALENKLSAELIIGGESIEDEFALVRPEMIVVDDNDYVYVADENRIKVFNKDGNSVKILGRSGQGPGEFEGSFMGLWISQTGYITGKDGWSFYNIFKPDNSLLEKSRLSSYKFLTTIDGLNDYKLSSLGPIFVFNNSERIISADFAPKEGTIKDNKTGVIIYLEENNLSIIVKYDKSNERAASGKKL